MESTQKPVAHNGEGYRPPARTIIAILLLVTVLGFCALATIKIMEFQAFSQHAFRVMDEFIAAKQADQPLGPFEEEFALLAASERDLGRMMAIAYTERLGSLGDRDRAIVEAANELTGRDLYRLLKSTSPMFDPEARMRYLNGETVGPLSSGIDLMFSTFTEDQQSAMRNCLDELEAAYAATSVAAQLKFASSLYLGLTWETCVVPASTSSQDLKRQIPDSI